VLGALAGHIQLLECRADGFAADLRWGDALSRADLGGEGKRPDAGVLAEGAQPLVQQRPEPGAAWGIEDRLGGLRP
jgi:hypothetical protein